MTVNTGDNSFISFLYLIIYLYRLRANVNHKTNTMAKIPQTYHHIVINGDTIHEEYIVNAPLTTQEMYEFTKRRLVNRTVNNKIMFNDNISSEPGCPDVISLNTYAYKLESMNTGNANSIKCYL